MLFVVALALIGCSGVSETPIYDGPESRASLAEPVSPYIVEIYQDRAGALWFGTMMNGAVRLKAGEFEYFPERVTLIGDTVTSFAEDADGVLWIGSHSGVGRYDGREFTPIGALHGLPEGEGTVWAERRGTIWVGTNSGIHRYDGSRFFPFELPIDHAQIRDYAIRPGRSFALLEDRHGHIWFAVDGYGVLRYNGRSFTRYSKADGLPSNNVTRIVEDRNGNLWFTCIQSFSPHETGHGGLCRFDGTAFVTIEGLAGIEANDIYTAYVDSAGVLWVGATGTGVYRFAGDDVALISQTNRMDLTSTLGLQGALEDRDGTMWLGFSGGLFRVQDGEILHVPRH